MYVSSRETINTQDSDKRKTAVRSRIENWLSISGGLGQLKDLKQVIRPGQDQLNSEISVIKAGEGELEQIIVAQNTIHVKI
jgi:hypothetical protein